MDFLAGESGYLVNRRPRLRFRRRDQLATQGALKMRKIDGGTWPVGHWLVGAALFALLSACGGGGDGDDPAPQPVAGMLTVTEGTPTAGGPVNGVYVISPASLTFLGKLPGGVGEPDRCAYGFSSDGALSGTVNYEPGTGRFSRMTLLAYTVRYTNQGTSEQAGIVVDRDLLRVTVPKTLFRANDLTANPMTVEGTIPLPADRSADC